MFRSETMIDPLYNYEMFMTQFGRDYKGKEKSYHEKIFNRNYAELKKGI